MTEEKIIGGRSPVLHHFFYKKSDPLFLELCAPAALP